MELEFKLTESMSEIQNVVEYNSEAFAEALDFDWSVEGIKEQLADGWFLYTAIFEEEIVSVAFLKIVGSTLYTKNTGIKLPFQGNSFSHKMKEFFEIFAKENQIKKIINYCRKDNFRGISLNESHGYEEIDAPETEKMNYLTWEKQI